jgi:hypothetical protein
MNPRSSAHDLDLAEKAWKAGRCGLAWGYVCSRPRRIGKIRDAIYVGCGTCFECRKFAQTMNAKYPDQTQ